MTRVPGAPRPRVYGHALDRLRVIAPVEARVIDEYVRSLRSEAAAWRIRANAATHTEEPEAR